MLALRHDWQERTLITVHNLGRRTRVVELRIDATDDAELRDLLRPERPVPLRDGTAELKLAAHDHRWFRLDDKKHGSRPW